MKRFLKKHGLSIFLVLVGLVGVGIVAYPSVSDYWNARVQTRAITNYQSVVDNASTAELEQIQLSAVMYNQALYNQQRRGAEMDATAYADVLNPAGDGIMGYVEIPTIDVKLPIYHGTDEKVLQRGVGHTDTSSLPVGGENTHAVLLGHRGLPSARLFTDLDQLLPKDCFEIHVLNRVLYYQIYDIAIVEPQELNNLRVHSGEDMVTLVTCTPYGVNTHRLLICGKRVEDVQSALLIYADARRISNTYAALFIGVVLWVMVMAVLVYISTRHRHHKISVAEQQRRRKILSKYQM